MLYKNTLVKIKKSFGRYFSLLAIVLIGVGFLAGLQASAPAILSGVKDYYRDQKLMDIKIVSSMGLTDKDVNAISKLKGVSEVVPGYSLEALDAGSVIEVYSLSDQVNLPHLLKGRMPKAENECLADAQKYQVGDTVTITNDVSDTLSRTKYKVVGTVDSPLYMTHDYGNATIGDGTLSAYIFIPQENFTLDVYTDLYVRGSETADHAGYTASYESAEATLFKKIKSIRSEREEARYQDIYQEAASKIQDKQDELDQKVKEQNQTFTDAQTKIDDGYTQVDQVLKKNKMTRDSLPGQISKMKTAISQMKAQLAQLPTDSAEYAQLNGQAVFYQNTYSQLQKLSQTIDTLNEQQQKLDDGKAEFNAEISKAQKKIDSARDDLSTIDKVTWYVYDRSAISGYDDLKSAADIIDTVARVFPLFFILIVMLMSSNTMARMIVEERSELGTLVSLGFDNKRIIMTYMVYVLSATLMGGIGGFYLGCYAIPQIIYRTFSKFNLPPIVLQFDNSVLFLVLGIAVLLMTVVTLFFCELELRQRPAKLMRPVPPKHGQKILLERIGFIWKHLSFTWKVTMRNIFRYKQRVFMIIVGVAGCAALLLTGFGLRDSINGVAARQYGDIFRYQMMLVMKENTSSINEEIQKLLDKEDVTDPLLVHQGSVKAGKTGSQADSYLIIPENKTVFQKYFNLKDKDAQGQLKLSDDSVIISEKIAEEQNLKAGDSLTVEDSDGKQISAKIGAVAENYIQNYIYMSPSFYKKLSGNPTSYNMILADNSSTLSHSKQAAELLKDGNLVNVQYSDDIRTKAEEGNESLNHVVVFLVIVASMLVIIVLYNLTSINISERKREIATLKVLGFTDVESNQYIYREAFLLTLMSLVIGYGLGILFHMFLMSAVESMNMVYFNRILPLSYLWTGLIILGVSVVMQFITYFKMKTIDMIESLKSVE